MVGIPQNDIGVDVFAKFPLVYRFYGSCGPHRHEYGCFNSPVICDQGPGTGFGPGVGMLEAKLQILSCSGKYRDTRALKVK